MIPVVTLAMSILMAAGTRAHVVMFPEHVKADGEYNMWYFRVTYGCEEVHPNDTSTYYPMTRMQSHVPAELVQSFMRVEYKAGWPAVVEPQDDGSAMITWTGAQTELENHYGLDLGILLWVPEQQPGVSEYVMETTVYCLMDDGSEKMTAYLGEEAPRIMYGSVCPAACQAPRKGAYGN